MGEESGHGQAEAWLGWWGEAREIWRHDQRAWRDTRKWEFGNVKNILQKGNEDIWGKERRRKRSGADAWTLRACGWSRREEVVGGERGESAAAVRVTQHAASNLSAVDGSPGVLLRCFSHQKHSVSHFVLFY